MKVFELSRENLRKAWNGADQYWFSLRDYVVKDTSVLVSFDVPEGVSQTAYFVSLGYIPYFTVSDEEVIRAYLSTLDNEKLKTALSDISREEYVETFWKYFNAYPKRIAEGWDEFENDYVLKKAISWCEENSINYIVK